MVEQADQQIATIITIGKAGEGKSTFLNELAGKNEVFVTGRSTNSMTQDVQIEIVNFNNNKLRIIDIPGLLDGRKSLTEWLSLLQKKIANIKIDGVMIVTKSQNIRIDASVLILAACINSFFENFQGNAACMVFTHCDQQPIKDSEANEYMEKLCEQVEIKNIIQDYIPFAKGNPQSLQKLQEFIDKRIQARYTDKKDMVVNQKPDFQQVINVMNDQYGDDVLQSVLQKEVENMKRVLNEKLDENNKIHVEQMKLMRENMNKLEIALKNAQQKEPEKKRKTILQKIVGWLADL